MSYLQKPDDFYRKYSNDTFYRDLIFALYGFATLCFFSDTKTGAISHSTKGKKKDTFTFPGL